MSNTIVLEKEFSICRLLITTLFRWVFSMTVSMLLGLTLLWVQILWHSESAMMRKQSLCPTDDLTQDHSLRCFLAHSLVQTTHVSFQNSLQKVLQFFSGYQFLFEKTVKNENRVGNAQENEPKRLERESEFELKEIFPTSVFENTIPSFKPINKVLLEISFDEIAWKLAMVLASFPLFVLMIIVGVAEGLLLRALRRFRGERESALLYHRAKRYLLLPLLFSQGIFIIWPKELPVDIWFLLWALAEGWIWMLTIRHFKKYI